MALDLKAKIAATTRGPKYEVGQMLPISDIRTDGGTQARAGIDDATAAEYAQAMQDGAAFPLIVVFHDGESYWLADGFHRVAAAQRCERTELRAEIQSGTRRDAILYACGANANHGARRTQADKRRAIERLLRDDEWKQWSDSEIARRCQVSHPTVAAVRRELYPENLQDSRMVERGGTTYQQRTAAPKSSAINRADGSPIDAEPDSAPDLPPEFAVIQRRYEQHDYTLGAAWDGVTQRFVVRKEGGTGVVMSWPDVLSKLERLESQPDPAHVAAPLSDRQAHITQEQADQRVLITAENAIQIGDTDRARQILGQVSEASAWKRDQLLATITASAGTGRQITLAFTADDCAALLREARFFANSDLTRKLPAIGQALVLLVEAIKSPS